jgi:hypothetical protein
MRQIKHRLCFFCGFLPGMLVAGLLLYGGLMWSFQEAGDAAVSQSTGTELLNVAGSRGGVQH